MFFAAEKDPGIIPHILTHILDHCVNGVTLGDPDLPDMPIVYANEAFEKITGYTREEVIGRNCRFLQGERRDEEAHARIRKAIADCQPIEINLKNYKKDGELFYNHLALTPLFDREGNLIYYLGIQYNVTEQTLAELEVDRLSEELQKYQ